MIAYIPTIIVILVGIGLFLIDTRYHSSDGLLGADVLSDKVLVVLIICFFVSCALGPHLAGRSNQSGSGECYGSGYTKYCD